MIGKALEQFHRAHYWRPESQRQAAGQDWRLHERAYRLLEIKKEAAEAHGQATKNLNGSPSEASLYLDEGRGAIITGEYRTAEIALKNSFQVGRFIQSPYVVSGSLAALGELYERPTYLRSSRRDALDYFAAALLVWPSSLYPREFCTTATYFVELHDDLCGDRHGIDVRRFYDPTTYPFDGIAQMHAFCSDRCEKLNSYLTDLAK